MIIKGTVQGGARWYFPDGKPCYQVEKKDGGMRDTNLRDAKKLDLVPSVTTILKILAKPGLEGWKISQAIISALTLPREEGESMEEFSERIAKDSQEEGKAAATKGTNIHGIIETFIKTGQCLDGDEKYVNPFRDWMVKHNAINIKTETSVAGDGYAGKMDLYFESKGIQHYVDYKTQDVKKGKPTYYDEYPMQLTAYSQGNMDAVHISIVIDRETGELYEKVYTKDEAENAWFSFLACKELWYRKNWKEALK